MNSTQYKKSNDILITIITATYNAESCLEELIKSLIPQKTEEIEFIIIDGGSTDNTLNIIKKNEKYIDYWKSEPDNGIYDAWNKGIAIAKGDWIMFLGADDILLSKAICSYLQLLKQTNLSDYDYISAKTEYVDNKGILLKILGEKASWSTMRKTMSASHVGSLHNKQNLFLTVGSYNLDFKLCADYELLLRKKNKLNAYFHDFLIARMMVGGMSFSLKAIYETFQIRKYHRTINICHNFGLYLRDCLAYEYFRLRKI